MNINMDMHMLKQAEKLETSDASFGLENFFSFFFSSYCIIIKKKKLKRQNKKRKNKRKKLAQWHWKVPCDFSHL